LRLGWNICWIIRRENKKNESDWPGTWRNTVTANADIYELLRVVLAGCIIFSLSGIALPIVAAQSAHKDLRTFLQTSMHFSKDEFSKTSRGQVLAAPTFWRHLAEKGSGWASQIVSKQAGIG